MELSVSSTWQIRVAEAAHLGYMTKIMESMVTDIMICMTYWIMARISPGITGSVRFPARPARAVRLRSGGQVQYQIRDGPKSDHCVSFHGVVHQVLLAVSAFFLVVLGAEGVITQIPEKLSRMIRLIRSILDCIFRERGMARRPIRLIIKIITGMDTTRISWTFWDSAVGW